LSRAGGSRRKLRHGPGLGAVRGDVGQPGEDLDRHVSEPLLGKQLFGVQLDIAAQQEAASQHAGHDEGPGDQGEAGSKQDESDQGGAYRNDELAAAVAKYPDRLAGFATLALKDVGAATKELERCVSGLGFRGVMVNGTVDGRFLDDARFLPFFEAAAALGVPVYLHPAPAPKVVKAAYFSGLPGELGNMLSIAGWGWHAETGLHTLRLIVSGLFDKVPGLQLVVGHMGEGLPYALARSSGILSGPARLRQTVAEYFKTNIHLTTSGYFTLSPLKCALEVVGIERLMYSVDYPFSPNTHGREFLKKAAAVLSAEDLEKLAGGNAEKVLKI